ncbi:sodium:dicarboxylate symporter [Trinickia dabaoshanensis]|uniref:Sodium:dicarboxylate symporter n=1 Tax=Trinickia dabaoshanensis TaxID=564714 RepID=A0A2N7VN20_9BURK|nr:cation:dicarboxylase symporter family transporter [Trinickia dabaoshanensis]PMS18568.1 sodium:dicarboxylate symporter [Trinickia dabaoshanensis]
MNALRQLPNSAPVLLLCIVLGCIAGAFVEPVGAAAYAIGQVYISLVTMAAVPLLVVAMFFGLRQLLALPRPGLRIGTMLMMAIALVALGGAAGTVAGVLTAPGLHLPAAAHAQLGRLILASGGNAGEVSMTLFSQGAAAASDGAFALTDVVPDNFFGALANGRALGILTCTILFGMAFAALSSEQTKVLNGIFESVYRALEALIDYANLLLPVLVFGTAAHLVAHTPREILSAMSGFISVFLVSALGLSCIAVAAIAIRTRVSFGRALTCLRAPMLVSFTSGTATAAIPHTIEAMSAKLGCSRGVAELVVPFGAVFVRAGSALYFALVTSFVANLYAHSLDVADYAMIGAAATLAAFASAGRNGAGGIAAAGIALSLLRLPTEAALVLFVAIDLVCDGPRNLLSLLSTCTVVALVSAGLQAERAPASAQSTTPYGESALVRLAFTRAQLALVAGCAIVAASLIVIMGIGVGAR